MARFKIKHSFLLISILVIVCILVFRKPTKENELEPSNKIEEMMVKNMMKAEKDQRDKLTQEEFKKLPKPEDIIQVAKGHLDQTNSSLSILERFLSNLKNQQCSRQEFEQKILIMGRSGLDLFLPWFHVQFGIFILDDPQVKTVQDALYSLTNLSNCAIVHHGDNLNTNLNHSVFKFNALINDICDDQCLIRPSLWSQMCQYFPGKALVGNVEPFEDLQLFQDLKLFYIYQDPRASLNPKSLNLEKEAIALCDNLEQDLKKMDENPSPKIQMIRFEDVALKPKEVFKEWHPFCDKIEDFNLKKHVDAWKLKFSMEQLMLIEDKCSAVLNRLEYQIYGSNDI